MRMVPTLAIAALVLALGAPPAHAQWTNTGGGDHGGADWSIAHGAFVSGLHTNIGRLHVAPDTTAYVPPGVGRRTSFLDLRARAGSVEGRIVGHWSLTLGVKPALSPGREPRRQSSLGLELPRGRALREEEKDHERPS